MRSKIGLACRAVAPLAGALLVVTNAHATYTVVDADLYPTSVLEERAAAQETPLPERYKVGFSRGATLLGPIARSFVDDLVPRMQRAGRITIVGRIDNAVATASEKQRLLALSRAVTLRTYLIKAGVSPQLIEVDVDASGNPQASAGISLAEVCITAKPDRQASVVAQARVQIKDVQDPAIPHTYRYYAQPGELRDSGPNAASRTARDGHLVEYINRAVQSGQMQPVVAVQLLRSLAEANAVEPGPLTAPQEVPVAYSRSALVHRSTAQVRVERWVLDGRLSLKDNLEEWAKASGWNPIEWEASNVYQVTRTTVLDGAFPDVLKRIADSTGLNICATKAAKVVRVTDANDPCDCRLAGLTADVQEGGGLETCQKQPTAPGLRPVATTFSPARVLRNVLRPASEIKREQWIAKGNSTLRDELLRWAERAGWRVVYDTTTNYQLVHDVPMPGRFDEAAAALVRLYEVAEQPLIADISVPQRLIYITDRPSN